jgi:putative SOS response-associated peptidase YedK
MCGRFVLATPVEALAEIFEARILGTVAATPLRPSWNVAPTTGVYLVRRSPSGGRELAVAHWGLVPQWAPDTRRAANAINARLETLDAKPTFRHLLAHHRCVVPMDGYYEWATVGGGRAPWFVHRGDGRPLAAAGLWSRWGDGLETCTVITRDAAPRLAEIHHRMPVLLDHGDVAEWLEAPALPRHLCDAASDTGLEMHRVSSRVNAVRHDDEQLLDPIDPETLFG